jgi:hypothetical protein
MQWKAKYTTLSELLQNAIEKSQKEGKSILQAH